MYHNIILALAATVAGPASGSEADQIIVTGSREPVLMDSAPVSATFFDRDGLQSVDLPLASDVLRLFPGVAVASTGPKGTQSQLRIRGAEANHSLLFVDGIRFNDPAAGNEARFEMLTTDAVSRIELVRGPQSALWGSEAIGGVIAIDTVDPLAASGARALAEVGSLDSVRTSAGFNARTGNLGIAASGGWLRSDGIDSSGTDGERDGYENASASIKTVFSPAQGQEVGLVGHWIGASSQFDGFDPASFRRADTLDSTDNSLYALRGWAKGASGGWSLLIDGDLVSSKNRNYLDDAPLNRTSGDRFTLGAQLSKRLDRHLLTAAMEYDDEDFTARDQSYFGFTDQDRSRHLMAFVGQWRAEWSNLLITDVAIRHDDFSAFSDATTFRVAALFRPAPDWTVHAGYGEGIAQPTFYDLFGFFPGSFAGNPDLRPESSKGWEAGIAWEKARATLSVTGFDNRLRDEIIDVFDPITFLSSTANASGKSRRRGLELAGSYEFSPQARLRLNYTYLDADEQQAEGDSLVREVRRPGHSANAILTVHSGRFDWGATLAYVGERQDRDFDLFPAPTVTLDDYVLGSFKLGYRLSRHLEAYGRVENAFDAGYQDVVGYHTAGRTAYAGLRLRLGD